MGSTYILTSWGKRKKKHAGGKKEKEKKRLCVCPAKSWTLALHAFLAFQYSIPMHWAKPVCV